MFEASVGARFESGMIYIEKPLKNFSISYCDDYFMESAVRDGFAI